MKKKITVWLIVAICLVVAGSSVCLYALTCVDFDFSRLSTEKYVKNTYELTDTFDSILVSLDTTDIQLLPSHDGVCRVVCEEPENRQHRVLVTDNTLRITEGRVQHWYDHIGIYWGKVQITVYLPQKDYNTISLETDTGDIRLKELYCLRLDVNTDTGDVRMEDVISAELFAETDTGDITLTRCDAAEIEIETDTGDVAGSLLTQKVFLCQSKTGDISVPESTSGSKCAIETDTGDIRITIAQS